MIQDTQFQVRAVGANARAVTGSRQDYDEFMALIGDNRFVLLGEASHGTHDFYQLSRTIHGQVGENAFGRERVWKPSFLSFWQFPTYSVFLR